MIVHRSRLVEHNPLSSSVISAVGSARSTSQARHGHVARQGMRMNCNDISNSPSFTLVLCVAGCSTWSPLRIGSLSTMSLSETDNTSHYASSDIDKDVTSTSDSSLPPSPAPTKFQVSLPSPFFPASLEGDDLNRQCPPLPSAFPPLPINETPRVTAAAVRSYPLSSAQVSPCYLQDVQTPDNWVKRHPALIRLTGKHPFNSEGYLTPLFNAVRPHPLISR